MLYVDIPSEADFRTLNSIRADACVSIYLPSTPLTQDAGQIRIAFGNLGKQAAEQLAAAGFDKRRMASLLEQFDDLSEDDEFWRTQANSLAVLATPDTIRTFRLANALSAIVEVSDRFHLKPLLRALTFPHTAYVLALSENAVRLVEVSADIPAAAVRIPDLPKDAASAVGKSTINDRGPVGRIHGSEGQKVQLTKYIRRIDAALRPLLRRHDIPVVLAATEPLASLFRNVSAVKALPGTVSGSVDRMSETELAAAARPVLDQHYRGIIADFHSQFEMRSGQNRTTTDMADAARAATFGAIDTLLVDIDTVVNGTIDEETGAIVFAEKAGPASYGVVDEIAGRALISGARVLGVRRDDIPGGSELAAVLRFPI